MESAGDDRVTDPQTHPDEAEQEGGGRFDPGVETGYLRRTPREYPLSPEIGAAPFDPGPGTGYDDRRAAKAAKHKQRQERRALSERRRQERIARLEERLQEKERAAAGQASLEASLQSLTVPEPDRAEPAPDQQRHEPAPVAELNPRRESLAERLEREREEREAEEQERRARIERERAERERASRERMERRRRERAEKLQRERAALRRSERMPTKPKSKPSPPAQIRPSVQGPVRKRTRAAENRRRVAARRRGLFWPTAKAGLAVTFVLALTAGLGSAIGLPVPGLDTGTGHGSLASSASLFGVDQGTPQGLSAGYVFPLEGPHNFGDKVDRFGAPRSGHIHEGQDIFGKTGTPEVAVHDGVVVDRGKNTDPDDGGRGNYVAIYSPADNHSFVYMHMLKPSPALLGHQVHAGQVIGQLGCTGSCDGPHLHFEVRIGKASLGGEPVDPLPELQQLGSVHPADAARMAAMPEVTL